MRDKLEAFRYGPKPLKQWCRRGESNPHESHPSPDFESGASANSATPAPGVASIAESIQRDQICLNRLLGSSKTLKIGGACIICGKE